MFRWPFVGVLFRVLMLMSKISSEQKDWGEGAGMGVCSRVNFGVGFKLPAEDSGAPGEAGAEAGEEEGVAGFDAAGSDKFVDEEWDGGG